MASVEGKPRAAPQTLWEFQCSVCQAALPDPSNRACEGCGRSFSYSSGIWHFLPEERALRYDTFLREYGIVRTNEGWGASDPEYYRALPLVARDDPQRAIWQIRAKSFEALISRVVVPDEARLGRSLKVLDLGAGNCWLSHCLAARGHHVVAVDVSTSSTDGLGAHTQYQSARRFLPVQAEFDHLPFTANQMDLIVFNASLHYSTDCAVTLAEARRVVRPEGRLVIMDSPVYDDPTSGAKMVHERETAFERRYGFRSNALPAENYLTTARLKELAVVVDLRWDVFLPFFGVGWMLRPLRARLRGRREPARHPLIVGTLVSDEARNGHARSA